MVTQRFDCGGPTDFLIGLLKPESVPQSKLTCHRLEDQDEEAKKKKNKPAVYETNFPGTSRGGTTARLNWQGWRVNATCNGGEGWDPENKEEVSFLCGLKIWEPREK